MTPTLLHAVARKAEAITPDADLLARFTRAADHPAFEELVRRHGPLVWGVCRHMLPDHADAEDAFQAVFLALARSGATIRDGRTVPAWLHGVAVRVATRAKRSFARRRRRERTAALPEADRPVADATWDALIAAVHEEVQRLPEVERTAFVLCDLEGVSQPDAAARLGWPLGSLSGRLCKARQRLMAQLSARGVAPAAALGIGLTAGVTGAIPVRVFQVVTTFPGSPGAASKAATVLARGLTEGVTMRMKLMAATTVVFAAFGLTGGAALLSKADAQPPGAAAPAPAANPFGQPATSGVPKAPPAIDPTKPPPGGAWGAAGGSGWAVGPATWEYKFVDVKSDRKEFEKVITQHGKEGWEFAGSERFGQAELVLVFKKSKGGNFGGGGAGGTGGTRGGGGGSGGGTSGAPSAPAGGAKGTDNLTTVLVFKHASATEVAATLTTLFPKGITATAEPVSNSLALTGELSLLKTVLPVVEELEAKAAKAGKAGGNAGNAAGVLAVVALKHASAEDLEEGLKHLFPAAEILVEPRTNQLIVRAEAKTLEEIQALVSKLDVETPKKK